MTEDQQITPEAAKAALSSVAQGQEIGRQRGLWPRWANVVEAAYLGLLVALTGYAHLTVPMLLVCYAGVAFRFWCIRRFGAFPRLGWINALLIALIFGGVLLVAPMRWNEAAGWLQAIIGAGTSIVVLVLYEVRRRLLSARRPDAAR